MLFRSVTFREISEQVCFVHSHALQLRPSFEESPSNYEVCVLLSCGLNSGYVLSAEGLLFLVLGPF